MPAHGELPRVEGARRAARTPAQRILGLQRAAGNTAVASYLAPRASVQRAAPIDLPAGGSVGTSATNGREAVLLVLDRLYGMWAIEAKDHDDTKAAVTGLPAGAAVTDPGQLQVIDRALTRLEDPALAAPVAKAQFALQISAGVGRDQPNVPNDVATLQNMLAAKDHMSHDDWVREHGAATSGKPLTAADLPATFIGIIKLKRQAAADTGRPGWFPIIRSDEGLPGSGGVDKLADRTFSFGEFMIFVPTAATKVTTNQVHVFFSAGGVLDASSHVEHHGLRGAAETGGWILFGVHGDPGKAFTISESQVKAGLASIGRAGQIASVRLSAHSRGNGSMARTLREVLFTPSLIDHVNVLDGSDFSKSLNEGFRRSKVPSSRITADVVNTGKFDRKGVTNLGIDSAGIRALGYARLINDAVATGRVTSVPAGVQAKVNALALPPRGSLSAVDPVPPGKTAINAFMTKNKAALAALREGEGGYDNVQQEAGLINTSAYAFVEWNNLLNLNDEDQPRTTWRSVAPGIYSHHLFVAEIAADVFG
ncbi:MAG: hypothetical protein QOH57_4110 [Mycobacterium sp.]|nr:hypothetical protein [Mycobacterium sp.]